ncbi:MAG: hypothetical protein ACR2OI_12060 [Acidimicrobiia bacterium]
MGTESMSDSQSREADPASAREDDWKAKWRDWLDIAATVVLALATILTAWSAFQSAKWSGLQTVAFSEASAARTESARAANLAGQQAQVDIGVFLDWLSAADSDIRNGLIELPTSGDTYQPTEGTLSGFIFERTREEFRPALRAWLDTEPLRVSDAPATPFDMPEYQLEAMAQADAFLTTAEARGEDARNNNQQSDNYVLMAVVFASVLFFVGLSSKLPNPKSGLAILIVGIVLFIGAAATVLTFPIEV